MFFNQLENHVHALSVLDLFIHRHLHKRLLLPA
jgi:hypothetical protein